MKTVPLMGSYVGASTPAARIDARVKIVLLLGVTVALFAAPGPLALALWCALLLLCARAARVGAASVARALKPAALVLAFVLCANLVTCDGSAALPLVGPVGLSPAGAMRGATTVVRIALLVGFALVVAASTTSTELADAFVRLLSPLGRLGVPVGQIGLALSVALRFLPIVGEEFERIRMAQRARGVRFEEGSLVERARRWVAVFAPLIVGLLRRADALADSMVARCYAGATQTPPRPLSRADRLVLVGGAACIALAVAASLAF